MNVLIYNFRGLLVAQTGQSITFPKALTIFANCILSQEDMVFGLEYNPTDIKPVQSIGPQVVKLSHNASGGSLIMGPWYLYV